MLEPPTTAGADMRLDEFGEVVSNSRASVKIVLGGRYVTTGDHDRDGDPGHSHPKI